MNWWGFGEKHETGPAASASADGCVTPSVPASAFGSEAPAVAADPRLTNYPSINSANSRESHCEIANFLVMRSLIAPSFGLRTGIIAHPPNRE